ncbi:pilus assembly protein TadG-related protein [Aeromicrobium sp. CTD01-1L150]|uniref:pilus assembly protein TadG-related protein n=1 Tax=Aeromicrobium sp. CTD01-1L150 TaxID=3341830 RepID=UPI0035C097F4
MRRPSGEDGSIMPMTALLVVLILGFTAFAVDLGLNRVAARDMQAVADAVALDTARSPALGSCEHSELSSKAAESLGRQNPRIGSEAPLVVTPGRVDAAGTFTAAGSACNAVRVTAATEVDFAFAPVIGTSSGTASRSAVGAASQPSVCFSAGTRTLVLNPGGSALGPLLEHILRAELSVVGYDGLVGLKELSVPLADLSAALDVGSPDELISLSDLSLQDLMLATATVLRNQGSLMEATVLESIGAQLPSVTVDLADILAIDSTGDGALGATINVLGLLGTAIVAANGTNAVRIDALDVALPLDLLKANARIVVVEPPQIACGRIGAQARTAQVRVDLRTGISVLGLLRAADIDLGVGVARGTATLTGTTCGDPATATISADTSTATVNRSGGSGYGRLNVVGLLGLGSLGVDVTAGVGSSSSSHTFTYASGSETLPSHTFGSPLNLDVRVANTGGLGDVLTPVTSLLTTVLNPLLQDLLTPLLSLLGVRVGTMDVSMLGRPSCDSVRLAG